MLFLALLLKHDGNSENIVTVINFQKTVVGAYQTGNRTQSQALTSDFGGNIFSVSGFLQGAGIVVGYIQIDESVACFSAYGKFLFTGSNRVAGGNSVFE